MTAGLVDGVLRFFDAFFAAGTAGAGTVSSASRTFSDMAVSNDVTSSNTMRREGSGIIMALMMSTNSGAKVGSSASNCARASCKASYST